MNKEGRDDFALYLGKLELVVKGRGVQVVLSGGGVFGVWCGGWKLRWRFN